MTNAQTFGDYFDPYLETMPRDQMERMQEAALLQLLPYVYQRSALTQSIWKRAGVHPRDIKSLADFREKAPFIDKDTIRHFRDEQKDPCGGLLCAAPPHLCGVGFTSGTTGDPTPVPRTKESLPARGIKRDLWQMGARPGDYFSYVLFTFREGFNNDMFQDMGIRPMLFQHSGDQIGRLVEASLRFRPTTLMMLSSPLIYGIDMYMRAKNIDARDVFSSYKGAVFGGEPLGPSTKALVNSWGLELFEYASLGDIVGAMECSAHDGHHTWEDMVLVEHLDPTGSDEVADGERGELVVTSLMDDVAPLVRYRTDDLITLNRERCSCGRTHGRMKLLGRKGDELLVNGRSVLPRDLLPLVQVHRETAAGLFQIVRKSREMDQLHLRVGYSTEHISGNTDELAGRLAEQIRAALEVPVRIELCVNEELLKLGPPHKIPRVSKS